ncbi:hypothetical protein ACFL0W_06860 [Nanoarchaeota archaeon]
MIMVMLFDLFHLSEDVFEIIFATEQQVIVAKMLVEDMKSMGGEMGKTEMSLFANRLHEGTTAEVAEGKGPFPKKKNIKLSYNKRQFYDRILTPMKSMGLIDYDMYKKKYMLSDKFNKIMTKIGLMWVRELQKKPAEINMHK